MRVTRQNMCDVETSPWFRASPSLRGTTGLPYFCQRLVFDIIVNAACLLLVLAFELLRVLLAWAREVCKQHVIVKTTFAWIGPGSFVAHLLALVAVWNETCRFVAALDPCRCGVTS